MKRFFQTLKNLSAKTLITSSIAVALTIVGGTAVVKHTAANFGPDRPTKAYSPGVAGFDHVTFNSFTGVPNIGDERDFLTGKIAGAAGGFYDPMTKLRDGDEVLVRVYVHNNADDTLNTVPDGQGGFKGIAKNETVRVQLPTGTAQAQQAKAFVRADNAAPQEVFDTLDMSAENGGYFAVDYVPGSATLKTNTVDVPVSDAIVGAGVQIGDNGTNGSQKGCFQYVELVTFKVKVKMPRHIVEKTVRKAGTGPGNWQESVNVKPGDSVEWRVHVMNAGSTQLNDINVVDNLPDNTTVTGSVELDNSNNPNGYTFGPNAVQGRQINVGIGDYLPGSDANVYFTTKIDQNEATKCGVHELVNTAHATPNGYGSVSDTAKVVVTGEECNQTETPVYSCDLLTLTKIGENKYRYTVNATAAGGATITQYMYTFGDSQTLNSTNTTVEHTYATAGNYVASVKVQVRVNGQDKIAESANCAKPITFTPPTTPPTTLVNTGPGDVAGIFAAVTIAGAFVHKYLLNRKFQ